MAEQRRDGCCKLNLKIIKTLMFLFTFIFWLSGLALLLLGILLRVNYNDYFSFAADKFSHAENLFIAAGVIVLVVGFVGCYGAVQENYCVVFTFALLMTLVCILEIAAGVVGYKNRARVDGVTRAAMHDAVKHYKKNNVSRILVNWAQQELECCGNNGVKDYNFRRGFPVHWASPCGKANHGIPSCHAGNVCRGMLHKEGCKEKLVAFVKSKLYVVGGVGVGFAFVQLVGLLLAWCLTRAIKWEYEVM